MKPGDNGSAKRRPAWVLSLDGGGAKAFYALGVLSELEALIGVPLHHHFDLIFGTSTGAIIGALLCMGHSVRDACSLYRDHVPAIMRHRTPASRSEALRERSVAVFGDRTFVDIKTGIGIVATRWDLERPLIFKGDGRSAFNRSQSFRPGFDCTIADAVRASCSAYPFFERARITSRDGTMFDLVDGGFCANNPTLFAIADVVHGLGRPTTDVRVVSVGVGAYPIPFSWVSFFSERFWPIQLLEKTLAVNSASMERLREISYQEVPTVRISETTVSRSMSVNFLEHDVDRLAVLFEYGRTSFGKFEHAIRALLQ